jgi:DNA-binding transcriptional LysR family regulator
VVEMPVLQSSLEVELIEGIETVVVLPAGHRLAAQDAVGVRDLEPEPLVLLSHQSLQRHRIEDWFARRRVVPNVVVETPQSTIACALVAAGAGVAIVSRVAAAPWLLTSTALVSRRLKERVTTDLGLVYPVIGARPKLVEAFAREMRSGIQQILRGGAGAAARTPSA